MLPVSPRPRQEALHSYRGRDQGNLINVTGSAPQLKPLYNSIISKLSKLRTTLPLEDSAQLRVTVFPIARDGIKRQLCLGVC